MSIAHAIKKLTIDNTLSNIVNIVLWWIDCGHYLENLNKDTLNLSLYALEIKNVIVKQSALSKMNLPVQVVFGKLEYAKVMAPWTELIKWRDEDRTLSNAEVLIDGLYLLVKPNNQVRYNREKEEQEAFDAKKAQLKANEEKAEETQTGAEGKPSFAWSIISKILRNLRITVRNIHIRYEDVLAPSPYSLGITLSSLTIQTKNADWEDAVLAPTESKTYKLATLTAFSFYLNCNSRFYSDLIDDPYDLLEWFKEDIATANEVPSDYLYMFGPMEAQAYVILNLNSAVDNPPFSIPILQIDLTIDLVNIELRKCQYEAIIHLVEGLSVQAKGVANRQFRPDVNSYRGHYRKWWIFAFNCVLEDVRRKREGWDWRHIWHHRYLLREYAVVYKAQLVNKKLSKEQQQKMVNIERQLDVLNMLIVREKVRIEVAKNKPTGWFGNLWGGSSNKGTGTNAEESKTMMNMIADNMTPDEKEQLLTLIKSMDKKPTINYPPEYIDVLATISLKSIVINISNEIKGLYTVINIKLKEFYTNFQRRPLADGMKVAMILKRVNVRGTPVDDYTPNIVSSKLDYDMNFLEVYFELNPLNSHFGQTIRMKVSPLRIILNILTLNELLEALSLPTENDKYTEEIPELTTETITDLKNMTLSGLKYVLEKHTIMEVDILIKAPFIIIPENGEYKKNENAVVVHLGVITIKSKERKMDAVRVNELHKEGVKKEEILKLIQTQIYDTFTLDVENVQVMIVDPDEDIVPYIFAKAPPSKVHLVNPLSINIVLESCLISDDPNLPILKISGEIPSVIVNIIDERILLLVRVMTSIGEKLQKTEVVEERVKVNVVSPIANMFKLAEQVETKKEVKKDFMQLTKMILTFVLKEFNVNISSQLTIEDPVFEVLQFKISSISVSLTSKTYNNNIDVCLGSISLKHCLHRKWTFIIFTEKDNTHSGCLFRIQIEQVDNKSPEFSTLYDSCEILITVNFGVFKVRLVQENLQELMAFKDHLIALMEERKVIPESPPPVQIKETKSKAGLETTIYTEIVSHTALKLNFDLKEIGLSFICEGSAISEMSISKISAKVLVKQAFTQISALLGNISVIDLNTETLYRNIIYIEPDEKAFVAEVTVFNGDIIPAPVDIDVKVLVGKIEICFINRFIKDILSFADKFQKAEEVIAEASTKAAETAKENINEIYEKAMKLKLDVNINAPIIAVPEGMKRYCGLALDLGIIIMKNRSIILTIKNQAGHTAVIDEIVLTINDMKMDKVKFDSDLHQTNKMVMLEPLLITIVVYRKLTMWYKAVPDLDVIITINDVEFNLGHTDYATIMNIVSINLNEGVELEKEDEGVKKSEEHNSDVENKPNHVNKHIKVNKSGDAGDYNPNLQIVCRWNLVMSLFRIHLFSTASIDSTDDKKKNHCPKYERVNLSEIKLKGLYIRGRIMSDESIVNEVTLINFNILDRRPDRHGKIICYLTRRKADDPDTSEEISLNHMMDVTLRKHCGDLFIEIRVCKFMFILSAEYFLKIADMFNVTPEQPDNVEVEVEVAKTSPPPPPQQDKEKDTTSTERISITLKIEKPHIVLVEDFDSLDTRSLMLNFKLLMKVRICGSQINVSGLLKNMQLFTCMFNPRDRENTKKMLLEPLNVNIIGSTIGPGGFNLEIFVTDIHICIALYTIELIMNILNTLSENNGDATQEEELTNYADIWNVKRNTGSELWFLKKKIDYNAQNNQQDTVERLNEVCVIYIESVVITIEAGVGSMTMPMLVIYSKLDSSICDWTQQLKIEAVLSLQVGYYNNILALWEPIVEPVAITTNNGLQFKPWDIVIEISQHKIIAPTAEDLEGEDSSTSNQAKMMIDIISKHVLEITVTKTCIEVLNNLANLFAAAASHKKLEKVETQSPFKVVNETGINITVILEDTDFIAASQRDRKSVTINPGSELSLDLIESAPNMKMEFLGNKDLVVIERVLHIYVPKTTDELQLSLTRANVKYFKLRNSWEVICRVNMDNVITIITLSSNLQIYNDFKIPINVYYTMPKGTKINLISPIEPGQSMYVPLKVVHSDPSELFFGCATDLISYVPYLWRDIKVKSPSKSNIICRPDIDDLRNDLVVITAHGKTNEVTREYTEQHTAASVYYTIHLKPAVKIMNYLPVKLIICVEDVLNEVTLEPGEQSTFLNINPGHTIVVMRYIYMEKQWSCKYGIPQTLKEFAVWTFNNYIGPEVIPFNLGMHSAEKDGSIVMTLYCPFWIINKTGHLLSYKKTKRADDDIRSKVLKSEDSVRLNLLFHPPYLNYPLMLSFDANKFFSKNKISVRCENGEWTKQFSLDTAGSSGTICSKDKDVNYQIGVHNQLTFAGLTKKITFTPYMLIINHSQVVIQCYEFIGKEEEEEEAIWKSIPPRRCLGLWPADNSTQLMKFRIKGTMESTIATSITDFRPVVLILENKYGGVFLDVQATEGSISLNLSLYTKGMAPALIVNDTDFDITIQEKHYMIDSSLPANNHFLFTWENPSLQRTLIWTIANAKPVENDLRVDDMNKFDISENESIYWIFFLDGLQRVLLISRKSTAIFSVKEVINVDIINVDLAISIHGIGLSLVNNWKRQEIMYFSITSSGVMWLACKENSKKFRPLNPPQSTHLENAYTTFLMRYDIDDEFNEATFGTVIDIYGGMQVDFDGMVMIKPHKRWLKRRNEPGIWLRVKNGEHVSQLHLKINKVQIDNQLHDCVFPILLSLVEGPEIKPFIEISIFELLTKNSQVKQYKYFKVLVQEFHLKIELGFINALIGLLDNLDSTETELALKNKFIAEYKSVEEPLYNQISMYSLQDQKSFFDYLHISPLKIHFSFSLSSSEGIVNVPTFLNILVQSVGTTLIDINDIVFKLDFFEREYCFLTQRQLIMEAVSHYGNLFMKQIHVLLFGLEVLGDPYRLMIRLSKGFENLFYEPYQGAILGPTEFADGLRRGVAGFCKHALGGTAGAISRITGAVATGATALTMDEEYQRSKRLQNRNKPENIKEGLVRGGQSLALGVAAGVKGFVNKPMIGARKRGAEGFLKGLAEGTVGLITRPTAGFMDFTTAIFQSIERMTDKRKEHSKRIRPPRFVHVDFHIRPYNLNLAEGNKLLSEANKSKYANDTYSDHIYLSPNHEVLLFSNKRLLYLIRSPLKREWKTEWMYTWAELTKKPTVITKGVKIFSIPKKQTPCSSEETGKSLTIHDQSLCELVVQKIIEHMKMNL